MSKEEIRDALKEWLDGNQWHYQLATSSSVFYMGVLLKSAINRIRLIVDIRDGFYLVYAIIGISGSGNLSEVMKFITMANYGLVNGNFEVDVSDGEIRYTVYVNCKGMDHLPVQIIKDSIYCACSTVTKYGNGIAKICTSPNSSSVEDEISKCETWQVRKGN